MINEKRGGPIGANGGLDGFVSKIAELPHCPKCKSTSVIPILYGLPSPAWEQKAAKGLAILGGRVVEGGQPDRKCSKCGHQFVWRSKGMPSNG